MRYFNEMFILLIHVLPFTPITPALLTSSWFEASYDTTALKFDVENSTEVLYGYSPVQKTDGLPDTYGNCASTDPLMCQVRECVFVRVCVCACV